MGVFASMHRRSRGPSQHGASRGTHGGGLSAALLARCTGVVVLTVCVLCLGARQAAAQSKSNVRTEVLRALGDGYPIHITYYAALEDKNPSGVENAAVVVLLHGEGGSRLIWDKSSAPPGGKSFAEFLNDIGYAVVTVDLRKHGESLGEGQSKAVDHNDYFRMARGDLPAVKRFLVQQHEEKKLNVNKLAIVASDVTVPVALDFAELDWRQLPHLDGPGGTPGTPRGQDVRALVLLSPVQSLGRLNGLRSLNFLKNPNFRIAFAIVAGTRDPADRNTASKLHQSLLSIRQNEQRVEFLRPNTNARGTDLLANQAAQIEPPILEFLKKHVKDLDSPWRTRRSRYQRDEVSE